MFKKKIEIVKLLLEKNVNMDSSAIIESLKVKGNLDIVKLLYSKGVISLLVKEQMILVEKDKNRIDFYYIFYSTAVSNSL